MAQRLRKESRVMGSDHSLLAPRPQIEDLLLKGNLPQAELFLRQSLDQNPCDPVAYNYLGFIALSLDLTDHAKDYFNRAAEICPEWEVPREYLNFLDTFLAAPVANDAHQVHGHVRPDLSSAKFLVIKAWGAGFWSDVSHVLSQLLVAEMTGRIPIVHWGSNSLFGDGCTSSAFDLYFDPVSSFSLSDILDDRLSVWPPKWNTTNLTTGEINKIMGDYSRISGLYLLGRTEDVVVADFYTGIVDLRPWIPASSPLHGLTVDELSRYLTKKYLRPLPMILERVNAFYAEHLQGCPFLSVHIRGSDKSLEVDDLHEFNECYDNIIGQKIAEYDCQKILLITDDARILERIRGRYGDNVVTTDCLRASGDEGVHFQYRREGFRLGVEVMSDVYLASKGKIFVGNGLSNVSLFVSYIKDMPQESICLLGGNLHSLRHASLHDW